MLDPARMDDVLRRGGDVATVVTAWRTLDEQRRRLQAELDEQRRMQNRANDSMAKLDKKSPEFAAARDELRALAAQIRRGVTELERLEAETSNALLVIPNAPHASVPTGAS